MASPDTERALDLIARGEAGAFSEAVALLRRAGEAGDGAAVARLAHLNAAGALGRADWDGAVADLRRAADLGWARARDEVSALGGDELDIRAFVAPRTMTRAHEAPRIHTIEGFMSAAECAWMIARGREALKPASVYDNEKGGAAQVSDRSNSAANLDLRFVDLMLVLLRTRIAHTLGAPGPALEPTNVLHYAPGQEFRQHVDYLDRSNPGLAADMDARGQRVMTFLVYLNDDYEGGETEFPRLPARFKGRTGDALVFANVDAGGMGDPRTLHAGLPPKRGEKWLLSQWVRDRAPVGV